jgi:hypothetical protein
MFPSAEDSGGNEVRLLSELRVHANTYLRTKMEMRRLVQKINDRFDKHGQNEVTNGAW